MMMTAKVIITIKTITTMIIIICVKAYLQEARARTHTHTHTHAKTLAEACLPLSVFICKRV
jgi:hypothetical protein